MIAPEDEPITIHQPTQSRRSFSMDFRQLAQSLEPFMDAAGETHILVQVEGIEQVQEVPIDTPLARSVVKSMLCPILRKGYPTDHETRTALDVIQGLAFHGVRREAKASADYQIARKPLAQAVMAVARTGGTKKGLPKLLATLTRAAQREGIDIRKGPWPANEDALGKQLSALVPILAAKGVALTRHENERPRTWTIGILPEERDGSGGQVTDANAEHQMISAGPDTSDAAPEEGMTDAELATLLNGVLS